MRVAVTGVAGFVGRYLSPALADAGHEVIGFGLFDTAERREQARAVPGLGAWEHCDVTEWSDVRESVRRWRPDAIVHLAAQASGALSLADPIGTFAANAGGTLHVLEAARESGTLVLLIGSSEAYGQPSAPAPLTEDEPLHPRNPYGASKAAADILGEQYGATYGLPVIRTRSFAHTGPGQTTAFALPSFAAQIAEAERRGGGEIVVGNLEVVRDYLDVRDVVRAYVHLVEKGEPGQAYNVCSGTGRPLRGLVEELAAAATVPITIKTDPALLRPVDQQYLVGDPTKITEATGWTPAVPLSTCLADLLDFWRRRGVPAAAPVQA